MWRLEVECCSSLGLRQSSENSSDIQQCSESPVKEFLGKEASQVFFDRNWIQNRLPVFFQLVYKWTFFLLFFKQTLQRCNFRHSIECCHYLALHSNKTRICGRSVECITAVKSICALRKAWKPKSTSAAVDTCILIEQPCIYIYIWSLQSANFMKTFSMFLCQLEPSYGVLFKLLLLFMSEGSPWYINGSSWTPPPPPTPPWQWLMSLSACWSYRKRRQHRFL